LPSVPETRDLYLRWQRYEGSETALIRAWLKPGDFVIDGGANVGLLTALIADCIGKEGLIWAVEASPSTRQKLNAVLKALKLEQVVVIPKALADGPGEVVFRDDSLASESNAICKDPDQESSAPSHRVSTTSLEDLCSSAAPRHPSLIKLDIEGAEPLAFRGWPSLVTTVRPPLLVFEIYPRGLGRLGFTGQDIFAALPVQRYRFWHFNASWPNEWPQFPKGVPFALDDPFRHVWPTHSNVVGVPIEGEFASRIAQLTGILPGL
jgi:FkbM family methyltransferase